MRVLNVRCALMNKVAAMCGPAALAELDSICNAVLDELLANPSEFDCPHKPDTLRNEVTRRVRVLGVEDRLDKLQIKRAVIRSFRKGK